MNRENLKPARTYEQQIVILKDRGLIISDEKFAKSILQQTNYYRLSAYSLGLRDDDNNFINNSTIEQIYSIYKFDEKLRHLLFSLIEPIEIRLRSEISYYLGTNFGNVSHLSFELCKDEKQHLLFLREYYNGISKSFSADCVKHNIKKYGELPIWAAVENLTFGSLSKFYGNLKNEHQNEIAKHFNSDIERLSGWFESLCEIRNICAHSGRIYNRRLTKTPKLYNGDNKGFNDTTHLKIFSRIIILKKIYNGQGRFIEFFNKLNNLIERYKNDINMNHLGFPNNWQQRLNKICPETNIEY